METFKELEKQITGCRKCPRLLTHCHTVAKVKKREYRDWEYWGRPVAGFGDPRARIWIVGLAPGAHGANRTGRVFTGDSSGHWLYGVLHKTGFANQAESTARSDGMKLKDVFISSAGRCAPPDNKPLPEELTRCEPFLDREYALLGKRRVILVLGNIAFVAVQKMLKRHGIVVPKPAPKFGHGRIFQMGQETVLCSYNPSRQNTNTRKLTPGMWEAAFATARRLVEN